MFAVIHIAPTRFSASGRPAVFGLAVVACAIVVGACGGSAPKPKHSASGGGSPLAFARCMRSHGVPNYPDPIVGGGGVKLQIDPSSPAFMSAQSVCQKYMPGGGPPRGTPSAQEIQQMVAVSRCMRAHGVSGFPDPTTGRPPPLSSVSRYSIVIDRGGVIIAVPKSVDPRSPTFQRASQVCGFGPGANRAKATGL